MLTPIASRLRSPPLRSRILAVFFSDYGDRRRHPAALKTAAGIAAVAGTGLGFWFLTPLLDDFAAAESDSARNREPDAAPEKRYRFLSFFADSAAAESDSARSQKSALESESVRNREPDAAPGRKTGFLSSFFGDSAAAESDSAEAAPEKKSRFLFSDSYRRRVFFNYERRMRMRSPPEKIFEYFASIRMPEGEYFMTPADFMRAVVSVFPPSESNSVREGYLRGERPPAPGELHCSPSTFFMLFDTNNDGLISFPEYIFFVTLFSISESNFSVAFKTFDLDNNGEIDREEFKKVMSVMRSYNRQGSCHKDGLRSGLRVGRSVENAGLVGYFFGQDGNGLLHHDKFVQFLRELHDEIVRLEFAHYDFKSRGTISAKDFALSLVASADIYHINKFLNRVDKLDNNPQLRQMRISFEEFKAFAELRKKLEPLSLALSSCGNIHGLLTKQDFKRAAFQVCGISVTDNMVDVIFYVFDSNNDNSLSTEEFLRALESRVSDIRQPPMPCIMRLLTSWLK